ncbi:restriction endonuclease subunit S [bacterium BD-1]|nr:restriction endonuclease subunit S [Ottowia caeni]
MSSEVSQHTLKSLCLLVVDCPHATPAWTDSGVVVLRNQNIKGGRLDLSNPSFTDEAHYLGRIRRAAPQAGDLVITREAPMGEVCQIPPGLKCCLGQRQVLLRPDPSKVDGRFLLYALQSPYLQHQIGWNEGTGSTVSNLRIPVLEALQVPTPPVLEQKAVAETLGAIDDRITLLRETNATLEAIAQALFKSWFLDFDPVRAKMEGRTPEGMDEATAALFPDGFEASELGEVPRGWKYSTAGESFVLTMGQSPPGGTYNESGEGLAFYQGRTDFGFRFPTQRVFCSAPTRYAEPGDTLVSVRAPVGDVNMALERCCIGRGVASVRHPSGFRGFTFYAMRGLGARFKAFDSEGTVFGSISKKDFQNLPVVVAPETVLRAYDEVTSPIDQRIVENEVMLRALSSLRDTLLPRLISGQLRLPEAMAALEATL